MLATITATSHSSISPRSTHRRDGTWTLSQSTMCPSMAISITSNADIIIVSTAIAAILPRTPCVQAQRKAKNPRGGGDGSEAGNG
ncbi:hypothetical protein D3C85_1019870 [compost metagenome]